MRPVSPEQLAAAPVDRDLTAVTEQLKHLAERVGTETDRLNQRLEGIDSRMTETQVAGQSMAQDIFGTLGHVPAEGENVDIGAHRLTAARVQLGQVQEKQLATEQHVQRQTAAKAELAQQMTVSNSTVRNLLSSAYLRLGVHSRTAAVEKAREMGLITPRPPTLGK